MSRELAVGGGDFGIRLRDLLGEFRGWWGIVAPTGIPRKPQKPLWQRVWVMLWFEFSR